MDDAADLMKPYEPAMIYLPDADIAEYIVRDCAAFYEDIGDGSAIIRDMDTREIIGFRIFRPRAWAASLVPGAQSKW